MQNYNLNAKTNLKYRSYEFSIAIIKFISILPKERVYQIITNQLLRAATSIGANIVEAAASASKKDFARYYEIALKSANETLYWLCLLRDSNMVTEDKVSSLINEANEIAKMLGASLLTMRGKR